MRKFNTWHGVDASTEESLFEYGFLIRWNSKNQMYDAIFAVGYDNDGNADTFVYNSWDADSWREDLKNGLYDLDGIADMCGMDANTYLDDVYDASLLNDILAYYGSGEVTSYYAKQHTEMEVRKKLNRALY